jgi:hypothetical protein
LNIFSTLPHFPPYFIIAKGLLHELQGAYYTCSKDLNYMILVNYTLIEKRGGKIGQSKRIQEAPHTHLKKKLPHQIFQLVRS